MEIGFSDSRGEISGIKVEIAEMKGEMTGMRGDFKEEMAEIKGDIKVILSQLKTEERMDSFEAMLREHIAACEKAKA